MTTQPDLSAEVWINLVRAHRIALSSIEGALKGQNMPPLKWYDVLLELDRVGTEGLRPFELEERLLLPQYGVSRLIDSVEKAGYLKRLSCEDDRRGQHLVITTTGKKLRKKMWPIYKDAIEKSIGEKFGPVQLKSLAGLLSKLAN